MATGLVVTSETLKKSYRLLQPIGKWGAHFSFTVFEAVILPERNKPDRHVAIKVVREDELGGDIVTSTEINRMDIFYRPVPKNILLPIADFTHLHDGVGYRCIVLPFDHRLPSLRSLMQARPQIDGGIPLNCIAFVLDPVLEVVRRIHIRSVLHSKLTAGNIFYDRTTKEIKVSFASSVYERDPPVPEETECPINRMLDWARPPEIETADFLYTFNSGKSDIWFLGITALELAYGRILTSTREQLLQVSNYISKEKDLPNTWQELITRTETYTADRIRPPKKRGLLINIAPGGRRFSVDFVEFVAICLATKPEVRMSADQLQNHAFMTRNPRVKMAEKDEFVNWQQEQEQAQQGDDE